MRNGPLRSWLLVGLGCLLVLSFGCVTAEVKSASNALDAARSAGKDKECPPEFQAAEDLVRRAKLLCNECKPSEANALAAEAMANLNALCPAKPKPAPPPVPPPPPAPTASLSASSSSIDEGGCTNLNWSTTNASSVSIDQGVGSVDASGTKQVCPTGTTRYTMTATGAGGTRTESATIGVTPKKPTDKLTIHVNFDTSKSEIRKADLAELQKAEAFVRKYSSCKVEIDGYTDSTGREEYNMGLSERRAEAVKTWLLEHGTPSADTITTKGYGESDPVGDNATPKGRFENRRAEILVFCQ